MQSQVRFVTTTNKMLADSIVGTICPDSRETEMTSEHMPKRIIFTVDKSGAIAKD